MHDTRQDLSGLNIGLIAHDDALRAAVKMLLLVSGFHVREYRSAREYIGLHANPNHCIIVDCSLPDMAGHRLCDHILGAETVLPVVAVTASPEDLKLPREAGRSFQIVRKPFDGQVLIDAIHEAVNAAGRDYPREPEPPKIMDAGT